MLTNNETLLKSCLESGSIASRMSKLGRTLSARFFLKQDIEKAFIDIEALEKICFAGYNNSGSIQTSDDITANKRRFSACFVFDKAGRLSRPFIVRTQMWSHALYFDVRSMPVILNNIHLQYRHSEDRATGAISYGENPYMRSLFIAMLMTEVAQKAVGLEKTGLFIPMNDGALVGRIERPREAEFSDHFFSFKAARDPKSRKSFFRKLTPETRPRHIAIINTYIGTKQIDEKMDTTQRILHDRISEIFSMPERETTFVMEYYFFKYLNGGHMNDVTEGATQKIQIKKAKTIGAHRIKRESGRTDSLGLPEISNPEGAVLRFQDAEVRIATIVTKLAQLMASEEWQHQSKISLAKPTSQNRAEPS